MGILECRTTSGDLNKTLNRVPQAIEGLFSGFGDREDENGGVSSLRKTNDIGLIQKLFDLSGPYLSDHLTSGLER